MKAIPGTVLSFRYDDFSNGSPLDFEERLFERFRRLEVPLTAGVVPVGAGGDQVVDDPTAPLDERRSAVLRRESEAGWLEVALHGYDHEPVGEGSADRPSEFVGLPREEQRRRIVGGRDLLAERLGRRPRTFVPPWNRYDATTVKVLVEAGFDLLSVGWSVCPTPPSELRFLPGTCGLVDLERALDEALGSDARPAAVVALFHPYDFAAVDDELGWLSLDDVSRLLERVRGREEVRIATLHDAAEVLPDLDERRARAFAICHESRSRTLLPAGWFEEGSHHVRALHTTAELERRIRSRWLRVALVYAALVAGGLGAGLAASALLGSALGIGGAPRVVAWGGTGLAALATAYALRDGPIYHRGGMAIAAACGLAVGGWLRLLGP